LKKSNTQIEDEISKILSESTTKLENQVKLVNMLKNDKESLTKQLNKKDIKIKEMESIVFNKDEELTNSNNL